MQKYRVVALGCRTNQYEAEAFRQQLKELSYQEASEGEEADLCIVNTCTVTEKAKKDSLALVRRLHKEHPFAKIAVTGCAVEKNEALFSSIEGVEKVATNPGKEQLLRDWLEIDVALPPFVIKGFSSHTRAFLKVQDGCDSFCTYCIIPYVRGRSRSRTIDEILLEATEIVANGYREIVLTGINIGDFDGNPLPDQPPYTLSDLLGRMGSLPGLQRVRLSSIDPDEVDERLIETLLSNPRFSPSLHIVLQSGSNAILKRMRRKYTRQVFMKTLNRLRTVRSDFTFTTDVIVGFPGETEEDFQATLSLIEEGEFAAVHMFPFSPKPRTKAALYPGRISPEVMRERKQRVLRAAEKSAYSLRQRFVGRSVEVLIETVEDNGRAFGHSEHFLPVIIEKGGCQKNEIYRVLLDQNEADGLYGRVSHGEFS